MRIAVRYAEGWLTGDLPDAWHIAVAQTPSPAPLSDVQGYLSQTLAADAGISGLSEAARRAGSALVVVSDITRPVPNELALVPVLHWLAEAGVEASQVRILIATGLHRPATQEEVPRIVGKQVAASGLTVICHEARRSTDHSFCGRTTAGIPVWVDRRYVTARFRIVIGLVEPHLMAGFSGGPKAICPGLCGLDTIMAFHSPAMVLHPSARPGVVESNPVYEQAWAVARLAGLPQLCINFVLDLQRRVVGAYVGDMAQVHRAGIAAARKALTSSLPWPADIVITSAAGYPLDLTFYQGIKGIVAAADAVRQDGVIIIAQRNAEGLGGPEFASQLARFGALLDSLLNPRRTRAAQVDEWQLVELARTMAKARIINVCPDAESETRQVLPVPTADSIEEAVEMALEMLDPPPARPRVAVLPDGPYTLVTCP